MEILNQFKENGYFTADLFILLTKRKILNAEKELTPSEYEREMRMSTAERLQSLNNIELDNIVGKDKNKAVLLFTPKIIIFQNFEPNKKYVAKLTIQNKSKASTYLNMVNEESSYFSVRASGEHLPRLAPGIAVTFTLTFLPEQYKDYIHEIIFYTDTDQYVFPVIAIGPRAIFNFPDEVVLPPGPLKVMNHATLSIQNVGAVSSGLTFNIKNPFSVQPKTLSLNPNEKIDVRIGLQTMHLGETKAVLNAILETGEIFCINLIGAKYEVNVELEKTVIRFPDTFNKLQRQQTIKILNKSNHSLTYTCMKNECFSKDFENKLKLTDKFYNVKELESLKSNKLLYYDVSSSDEHERVCTRIFCDEIEALAVDESLYFKHPHFSITPLTGTIWANSSAELTVTFSPNEIGELEAMTYMDVDGVASRIPLKITGTSLPPSITLNLQTLDVNRIYIKKTYNYEIVATNKGHINGTIGYVEQPTLFGGKISCHPKKLCLRPGEMDTFVLSFCSSKQGSFFEEIHFAIRDSPEVVKVFLRGAVVYPSLAFSLPLINFGHVCLGVPKTLELEVVNESTIEVSASVHVPTDGTEFNSITLEDYAQAGYPKPELAHCPKEFIIEPNRISIKSESSVILQITLTANIVREYQTRLEVELDESENLPITLPITFNATVPAILKVPDLILDACVLDYPYRHVLDIKCSNITGYFSLYESQTQSKIKIDVDVKEGFIKPKTILKLPIIVTAVELGRKKAALRFNIFGLPDPVHVCYVTATGVPPTVTCSTSSLSWGQIKLLTMKDKSLTLYNLSPIVIPFSVQLAKNDDKFIINPNEGQIKPESEFTITFGLYLVDAENYSNKAVIKIKNLKDLIIPLTATGIGTSIMIGELRDRVELGKHFTKLQFQCQVTMQNFGTRIHTLEWCDFYKLAKPNPLNIRETKRFDLQPRTWKMLAGEKVELAISGTFDKAMIVDETWYLVGCVEGINKKELLAECQICATFVDPEIMLSPLTIDFRFDHGPYNEYYKLIDTVAIKNITTLPLDLEITTKPPFAIIKKSSSYKLYPYEESVCDCYLINRDYRSGANGTDLELRYSQVFIDCVTQEHNIVHKKSSLSIFEDINKIKEAYELTYIVEEQLQHQEVMKLQVLFDTSEHTSPTSQIYRDLLKVKLKGHKNKDAVELIGEINHPNVSALTRDIDFQCILNKSITSKSIKIQNMSPLLVCYKLKWKEYSITAEPTEIQREVQENLNNSEIPVGINFGDLNKKNGNNSDNKQQQSNNHTTLPDDLFDSKNIINYKVLEKIAPIIVGAYDTSYHRRALLSQKVNRNTDMINRVLQVEPNGGLLKPNEIQEVHITFTPPDNISITALLECVVLGGPSTYVSIVGRSARLSYYLSPKSINFKIRSFNQSAFEKILLSNKGFLPFQFNAHLKEGKNANDLYMTIVSIKPKVKLLNTSEEIEISVEIKPGLMGYFKRSFYLEVGHLPPLQVDVYGWGVIPQVYLNLPRCKFESDLELQYAAIATLTLEYIDAVKELFGKTTSKLLNSSHNEKFLQDALFDETWDICSIMEEYPSTLDIDFAIEREIVTRYLKQNPNVISTLKMSGKHSTITGFETTPYLLDLGVVTNGTLTSTSIDVTNYGPNPIKLSISRKTIVPPNLNFKLCGKINSGETGKIEITYTTNVSEINEAEQKFEAQIVLEIPFGISIPVHVKALCALPYLHTKVKSVYFGSVRCGDKIFYTIPLKNIGAPPCIWYATVKMKTKGSNAIKMETTSGRYEPGEGGLFRIAFCPTVEAKFEALLVFTFHMNPNKLSILVGGKGMVPRVVVIGPRVTFPPTLPYADTAHNYFGITNPCPFPVELIFAHNDVQWKEDEEIYTLLNKYYNEPNEMLIPIQKPGSGWPEEIIRFYTKYKESVKRLKEEQQHGQKLMIKPSKKTKLTRSLADKPVFPPASLEKIRSDSEIARDVMQNMKALKLDPLGILENENKNCDVEQRAKGVLIIFQGPPCIEMECQEMAYSVGKELNLPAVTVDNCIVEALCTSVSAARTTLLRTLDEQYTRVSTHRAEGGEESDGFDEADDDFDIIWKKIEHTVQTISKMSLASVVKRTKKKDKESISKLDTISTMNTTMFDLDLVQELLMEYFNQPKYARGFIVVSLNSKVVKRPDLALAIVLKCKPTIHTIRLVLGHMTLAKWMNHQEMKREKELLKQKNSSKEYSAEEISEIITNFEKMNDADYESSDPELRELYIKYVEPVREVRDSSEYNEYVNSVYSPVVSVATNWLVARGELAAPLYSLGGLRDPKQGGKKKTEIQPQKEKCECDDVPDLLNADDFTQEKVLKVLSQWECKCGKSVKSSLMKNIFSSGAELRNRITLRPGELLRCAYTFSPRAEGQYSARHYVEVAGWPPSRLEICASGVCDIPRLDTRPKKMFENFVRHSIEDHTYKGSFLDDKKIFELGDIFVGKKRVFEESYQITLRNTSLMGTAVEADILGDRSTFRISNKVVELEAGSKSNILIHAAPKEVGNHRCTLLLSIRDNPEIITIRVSCTGIPPLMKVLPDTKILEYGKHLLYRKEDNKFVVKNNSVLPIKWKIRNTEELSRDFMIKQSEGVLQRDESVAVKVVYNACRVGVIDNQQLILDVYDEQCRGEPILTEVVLLSAECYDVLVDYSFDNPNDYILNYGDVKVRSTVKRRMFLLNRGKYNVYFKLRKKKGFPDPVLLQSFNAIPDHGVLVPNLKPVVIEFECTPTAATDITDTPVYGCTLLDDSDNQTIVATFPVNTTITCAYNTFTLFPASELNFYVIPVGSEVTKEVVITNTGKSPFTYEIVLPPQYRIDLDTLSIRSKDKNKFKNMILKCGNFTILTSDNLVQPKSSKTITIQFTASTDDKCEETLKFVISDSSPEEAEGVPFKLMGRGAIPSLDFWNIDVTFREHVVVKKLSDYTIDETTPHCVFAEESLTLHFLSAIVNTSHAANIFLYNNGLVPCLLKMKLHYLSNNCNQGVFWLDKYETQIESLFHKSLCIHFRPKAMTEYRAMLEINLKLTETETKSYKIFLLGEGAIPRIALISPPIIRHGLALLEFPLTCVESVTSQEIRIKNVSSVKAVVTVDVMRAPRNEWQQFWVASDSNLQRQGVNKSIQVILKPNEVRSLFVHFNPNEKGRISCDVELKIYNNPFESFTILCKAESFLEDITLKDLEMLPMDIDLDTYRTSVNGTFTSSTTISESKRKIRSAPALKKSKSKVGDIKKGKLQSRSTFYAETMSTYSTERSTLKYILDFGDCELFSIKKRSITMVNNSKKVYKFQWGEVECIVVRPSAGYIAPGEEKDLELWFYANRVVAIKKELLYLHLEAISDESLISVTKKDTSWDCRQTITVFDHNQDVDINERRVQVLDVKENKIDNSISKLVLDTTSIVVVCSATSEYPKFLCELTDEIEIPDTFIYQSNKYEFHMENIGKVPFKIEWTFSVDDRFPVKPATINTCDVAQEVVADILEHLLNKGTALLGYNKNSSNDSSTGTLFSERANSKSIDTWMDVDLPFSIEPPVHCVKPEEICTFVVTFSPTEAFVYNVKLKGAIDNLDPKDEAISCNVKAKSLIPYVHLAIEDNADLRSRFNIRSTTALLPTTSLLQFNVLGTGCFKKNIKVINPTKYGYEFVFEMVKPKPTQLTPIHCNLLKGYIDGGSSTEVTFTFAPSKPGVYESHWQFSILKYSVRLNLQVAGVVRESDVTFQPPLLMIRNSVVGVTARSIVILKNNENENLNFNFKGNSLNIMEKCDQNPVIVKPEKGVLRANSEMPITIMYTPKQEGPLSFKIYCDVIHMTKGLALSVHALSHAVKPVVSYSLLGNVHYLTSDTVTDINLNHCQPPYSEEIPFTLTNEGSTSFNYSWRYSTGRNVQCQVEPNVGHAVPGAAQECVLRFTLKRLPVQTIPVILAISDGPEYKIVLHVHIDKPACHFSCKECDFGKCIVDAPDGTYHKIITFRNDDNKPVTLDFNCNDPELSIKLSQEGLIKPKQKINISITFQPKELKRYVLPLEFLLNSLCKETFTIIGESVPLLFDLYEGCQRSINLGHIRLGKRVLRQIEVINHSKVPIDARFMFKCVDGSGDSVGAVSRNISVTTSSADLAESNKLSIMKDDQHKTADMTEREIESLLSSLKVTPKKCKIRPYEKRSVKILFKPVRGFKDVNFELLMNVLHISKPLVRVSGTVSGISVCLSTSALQFGCLRRRACKTLKLMVQNKGNSRTRFNWQQLSTNEFTISPTKGTIEPQSNAAVTVTFQPVEINPFVDRKAKCNIENYKTLELALSGTCMDVDEVENKVLYIECPVRESKTENITVTNPTDDEWVIHSEMSDGPFETLKEVRIRPNSTYDIPIHFKPKKMGKHESQILFYPIGESTLFVTVVGIALEPSPNDTIKITVPAKDFHTEELIVYNITKLPETYSVVTEVVKTYPDKFKGYFEVKCPDTLQVCGRAASCNWTFVCYDECQIVMRVIFVNEEARELQYYDVEVTVTPSNVKDTLTFVTRERESVTQELVVQNPLSVDADFVIRCDRLECPNVLRIQANSQATLPMVYSPLFAGEWQDQLNISNSVIGTISYNLVLKCLPADEKNVEIAAAIGSSVPLTLKVQNKTKSQTNFKISVSHPSIIPEKVYTLGGHEKGKFRVLFEPTELGVQACVVSFDSPDAGHFRFNVKGTGLEPQPQGPYEIKAGDHIIVPFKNVFTETRTFKVSVDREEFHVNTECEKISPKTEVKLTVRLCKEPARGWPTPPTACLTVQPLEPPEPNIHWIYFLQGKV
ncbi:hydrocephalus-inducing protein homolog [Aricia agestis]|uniref:hydrocephalus-inducing protein homolog n=1 Tax=Aricia agestis TaxID=91739 RepID=UPI001C20C381|nr:hydrocephalus-inducing protein homolog [Aricia agestis]